MIREYFYQLYPDCSRFLVDPTLIVLQRMNVVFLVFLHVDLVSFFRSET